MHKELWLSSGSFNAPSSRPVRSLVPACLSVMYHEVVLYAH
jgi:hypothetical protein